MTYIYAAKQFSRFLCETIHPISIVTLFCATKLLPVVYNHKKRCRRHP